MASSVLRGWAAMLCGREVCYACQLLEYGDECCWEMESCTAKKKKQKKLQTQTKQLGQKRRESSHIVTSHCQLQLLIVFTTILCIRNIWTNPAWTAMRFSKNNGVKHRMNPTDFGDPLPSTVASLWGQCLWFLVIHYHWTATDVSRRTFDGWRALWCCVKVCSPVDMCFFSPLGLETLQNWNSCPVHNSEVLVSRSNSCFLSFGQ